MAELWQRASQEFIARKSYETLKAQQKASKDGFKNTIAELEGKVQRLAQYPGSPAFKAAVVEHFAANPREVGDQLFADDLTSAKAMTNLCQSLAAARFFNQLVYYGMSVRVARHVESIVFQPG